MDNDVDKKMRENPMNKRVEEIREVISLSNNQAKALDLLSQGKRTNEIVAELREGDLEAHGMDMGIHGYLECIQTAVDKGSKYMLIKWLQGEQ